MALRWVTCPGRRPWLWWPSLSRASSPSSSSCWLASAARRAKSASRWASPLKRTQLCAFTHSHSLKSCILMCCNCVTANGLNTKHSLQPLIRYYIQDLQPFLLRKYWWSVHRIADKACVYGAAGGLQLFRTILCRWFRPGFWAACWNGSQRK